ncbi:fibrinogen C domain-containing protein 1-like [Anopheles albimanus]|uniref:fibrinogen C domain-containing protein 1-like n=1 Tax=Anopheles albimanus TaxID=7167 RepID=UPI00163EC64F|nr:fibrinogen C domain-containing protein 1-like [Anopheles albimanus]
MELLTYCLIFGTILCVAASDHGREREEGVYNLTNETLGFGLQMILNKIDAMTTKLQEMEDKLKKMENDIHEHRSTFEQNQRESFAALHNFQCELGINLTELQNRNQEQIHAALHKVDENVQRVLQNQYSQPTFPSCKNVPSNVSDTYVIRIESDSEPFRVYCEQFKFGGGWIVFQYRYDGSLDFYRNWNEFRNGFGDLKEEFWLGLEKVHEITKSRRHELVIEMRDFNGSDKYARYDTFEIGSEREQYILKDVGAYNGTAGDEMQYHKGKKFSTKDRDNDDKPYQNCANSRHGAWWHGRCNDANLNGRYMNADDEKSMSWFPFNANWQGLSLSRMMIRELE